MVTRGVCGAGRGASAGLMREAGAVALCALKSCAAKKDADLCSTAGVPFTEISSTHADTVWGLQTHVR